MHAVVTAGGAPAPNEPLYPFTRGGFKALLDIQGKPMIQWVLDALGGSSKVDRVVIVGLPVDTPLRCARDLTLVPNQGEMLANFRAGVRELQKQGPKFNQVLAISSDIPAITSAMVDWMVDRVRENDVDIHYTVIRREAMEARYPGSHRSYVRFTDMRVCGGDLNALRASALLDEKAVYNDLVASRKTPLRQAAIIGLGTLIPLLLGRLSLAHAEAKVTHRLGISGKVLVSPYPEMGMDVDKPHQLELVRGDLAREA